MSEIRSQATAGLALEVVARRQADGLCLTEVLNKEGRSLFQMTDFTDDGTELAEGLVTMLNNWTPPPRTVNSAAELDALGTGTVVRSKNGDIGSIDHGPQGNWTTRIWMLDFISHGSRSVAEFAEYAGLPATVLFTPGEAGSGGV